MKKVVIAEKPSVAREIAKTLFCFDRGSGYIEGERYIITWALGHLVGLCDPSYYSDRYKRWSLKDLPILPEKLEECVLEETKEQFENIKAILSRKDIESVVIATDAGREGELVARWILKLCEYNGKTERLWISSQTEKAIKEGFSSLQPGSAFDNLYHAAFARSAADWYVGMNVSRALTCYYDAKLSAGRVQTPTLALITKKEDEIEAFLGKGYYTARGDFGLFSASYYPEENSIRFTDKELKNEFETNFVNKEGRVVSLKSETKEEKPPLLYDLTELQRDANLSYGFSAKETLDILQRLYEVHKIVTYPRTDSRYLTSDIESTIKDRLKALAFTDLNSISNDYLLNGYTLDKERYFQESKVTDHHAIIPTETVVKIEQLSFDEKRLFSLIALRFLEALNKSYQYTTTTCEISVDNKIFKTRLSLTKEKGFKALREVLKLPSDILSDNSFAILRLKEGDSVKLLSVSIKENITTPPERYTDATLLSAMEHAGRFVDDIKLKSNLSRGLGTVATRADIIEKLVQNHYIRRDGKYIIPTEKGREVVRLSPKVLQAADLTGLWEERLENISKGYESVDSFIKDIKEFAASLVSEVKSSLLVFEPTFVGGKKCPYCSSEMMKAEALDGTIHYICQRLSCSYEEREVRVLIDNSNLNKQKKQLVYTPDGKVKVSLKKSAPKAVYETKIEVVRESKKKISRSYESGYSQSGGSFKDFFIQSQKRDEERKKSKRK